MAKANANGSVTSGTILNMPSANYEIISMPDGRIAVVFDPKKKLGPSASGKSVRISSTNGNISVLDFTIGFNAYRKNEK